MENNMFNCIIQKNIALLKHEEHVTMCSLIKLHNSALEILSKNNTKLSVLNKFQENIFKKALYAKEWKEALSEQLQEALSTAKKDSHAVNLRLQEKETCQKKLEELRRKKDELTNNKKQTDGQQINVDNLKNCLKVCKVLTKTHFDFGSSVCGYTLNEDLNYKCFEFKRQEDQHKITEFLWNNLITKNCTLSL